MPNKEKYKGKIRRSIRDRKANMTLLCFKSGWHSHYVVVCPRKGLYLLCWRTKYKLKELPKEKENYNEAKLIEECENYEWNDSRT